MSKTRVCTRAYTRTHGRQPKGFGVWMFHFDNQPVEVPGGAQHFGTARQWAVMEARSRGVSAVAVAP